MKLTTLGTGMSTTRVGDTYRYPSAHLVEVGEAKILFDAGIGVLPQLARLGVELQQVHTICISHYHADHFAIGPILQAYYLYAKYQGQQIQLRILGPSDIEERVRLACTSTGWTFDDDIIKAVNLTFTPYQDQTPIDLGEGIELTPFRTKHYNLEAYALRLSTASGVLAYSGDSAPSDGLSAAVHQADIFLCESAVAVGSPSDPGHISPHDAGVIAQNQGCKKLVLTHYSGKDSAEAMINEATASGYKGQTLVSEDLGVVEA